MKYFYISSITGRSGICKYSLDFYEFILKPRGFIFIDSSMHLSEIFTKISSRDYVHIETGIFQTREIEILFLMLNANYGNVSITLHDAPLLTYPFKKYNSPLLNNFSKFYDRYIVHHKNAIPFIKKIKNIYVLTKQGAAVTRKVYKTDNVCFLPHIVTINDLEGVAETNKNFLYFGFIGRNKGIEYSLKLHQLILKTYKGVQFYIIGTAIGKQKEFYNQLKLKYTKNVHFLGYVPEDELEEVYDKASFAIIMFKPYKFFYPVSGSILYSLKKGKIVLTNSVNTIPEIISDNKNGIYLTGNLNKDEAILLELYDDKTRQKAILKNAVNYLYNEHAPEKVAEAFFGKFIMRNEVKST
jgi:glycosyltransferase involved in cell wall biosynthesis